MDASKIKVLVLDGQNKNALAVIRSIGKKGFTLGCCSDKRHAIGLYSRYVEKRHIICPPSSENYISELIKILDEYKYDVLIPVGLKSYLQASKHKNELSRHTNLLVPDWESMKIASNKNATFELAEKLNLPIPKTLSISNIKDISLIPKKIGFPLVLKSSDSGAESLRYCNNEKELRKNYFFLEKKSKTKIIAQEYINGTGHGFYALIVDGECKVFFMHQRIKEYPITGGASAVAKSYYDEKLKQQSMKLIDSLNWNGPIMIEYKKEKTTGEYKLIEINPKLWGSLDLTIDSGVDIPYLILQSCINQKYNSVTTYDTNITYRWLFPDEILTLMSDLSPNKIFKFLKKQEKEKNNFDVSDPVPTLLQITKTLFLTLKLLMCQKLKFPSGKIKDFN